MLGLLLQDCLSLRTRNGRFRPLAAAGRGDRGAVRSVSTLISYREVHEALCADRLLRHLVRAERDQHPRNPSRRSTRASMP